MLTESIHIELCRPLGACNGWSAAHSVGFHPTLFYIAPSGLARQGWGFAHSVGFHPTLFYVAPSGLAL